MLPAILEHKRHAQLQDRVGISKKCCVIYDRAHKLNEARRYVTAVPALIDYTANFEDAHTFLSVVTT